MFYQYKNYEKMFVLMPLLHSEVVADVGLCVKEFSKLHKLMVDTDNLEMAEVYEGSMNFAKDHLKVIEKFERYPNRN